MTIEKADIEMRENKKNMLREIEDYYSQKLMKFGASSQGVDWNGIDSHTIRFKELSRVLRPSDSGSTILDFGCGYGAFLDFINDQEPSFEYFGSDISEKMIQKAKEMHPDDKGRFMLADEVEGKSFDFTIANGVFNVKLNSEMDTWQDYIMVTLDSINAISKKGFAFNILTSYSDSDRRREHLYYADPVFWFDWCKSNYSRNVALLHDYNLYEFTLIVRKT